MNKQVKIKNAKGETFDAIQTSEVYEKNWAKHYGQSEPFMMNMVKVRRFIKSRNEYAATSTEYPASAIVA